MESRLQYALLAIFFALLWWIVGVLSGSVAAFLIYFLSPEDSGRDWPAITAFSIIALGFGGFGIRKSWQLYIKKAADLAP
ncbi:MAG: hypothetical protein HKN77_08135 [Woeseiaceae bacterium]|nr:hypothetical protein [Woeseiaceae bacterium]